MKARKQSSINTESKIKQINDDMSEDSKLFNKDDDNENEELESKLTEIKMSVIGS